MDNLHDHPEMAMGHVFVASSPGLRGGASSRVLSMLLPRVSESCSCIVETKCVWLERT